MNTKQGPADPPAHCRSPRQRGMSMVELMVAMALGVVLVLGLIQVFGGVRSAFSASEGLSRLQENARFATEFIRIDARMAGHFGCRSEYQLVEIARVGPPAVAGPTPDRGLFIHTAPLATETGPRTLAIFDSAPYTTQLHRPVQVYDYVANGGTSPGNTHGTPLADFPGAIAAANNFVPNLPPVLVDDTIGLGPGGLTGGEDGDAVPGSDIIMMRYMNEVPAALLVGVGGNTGGLWDDGTLSNANAAVFPLWRLFGVTDCKKASLFQITGSGPVRAVPSGAANLNRISFNNRLYGEEVPVYAYEVALYYVGRTGDATPPALFRRRLLQAPANADEAAFFGPAEELVPGVEMMQVLIGTDTEAEAAPPGQVDDVVDAFRSASQHLPTTLDAHQNFDRERSTKSLRVSLLMRSPEIVTSEAPVIPTRIVGDVVVTPPNDFRLRHVYETNISIRNRVRN